jgi:DNA-directed RNA polymerase specialized sigma24 family protein
MVNNSEDVVLEISEDGIKHKDGFPYWHTPEEHKVFTEIDRKQENKDVIAYQKSKDNVLFEKIYAIRIPTLQVWSRRYHYLMDNRDRNVAQEDMFGELSLCFIKAVYTYNKAKGAFNTWLFYILINCVRNLVTGKKAKKRLPEGLDPKTFNNLVLSLDHAYFRNKENGNENSLKDFLPDHNIEKHNTIDKLNMKETLNILSAGNPIIKGFLKRLGDGDTLATVLKAYRTVNGEIKLDKSLIGKLNNGRKCNRIVSDLIKNKAKINDDFTVIDYYIDGNELCYTIEKKKTPESNLILKTIRKLKKDKVMLLEKIRN